MDSYRESHVGSGCGERYDASHAAKMDGYIWDALIKDYLNTQFARSVENGATRYLDFACGTGRVLEVGSQHFLNSTGIDVSEDMLSVARSRVPEATILCGDVTKGPLASDKQFDCVSLFRFLLNAERELCMEVLHWLAEHMPPGGILIANNHMNLASFRGVATWLSTTLLRTNHNFLSRNTVIEMLSQAGFRVVEWSGYRILPTVRGRPIFGKTVQVGLERLLRTLKFERLGSEQLIVAQRV